jgi:hypothetical protein
MTGGICAGLGVLALVGGIVLVRNAYLRLLNALALTTTFMR